MNIYTHLAEGELDATLNMLSLNDGRQAINDLQVYSLPANVINLLYPKKSNFKPMLSSRLASTT